MRGAPFFQEKERGRGTQSSHAPCRSPARFVPHLRFAESATGRAHLRCPRSPPKKAARVFLFRRAEGAPERSGGCGEAAFCEREPSFRRKKAPSRALPQESRKGFPVPSRGGRAGTERRLRGSGFLREGAFFQEKEGPLSRSPLRKPQGFSCSDAAVKRNARARRPLRAADAGKRLSSGKGVQGENLFFLLKEEVFPLASPHPFATM